MRLIVKKLLAHYDKNARDLPWRVGPNSPSEKQINPYHIWLSEIMLQQTTVAAVIPYFERFITRWPSFHALATAQDNDVMAAWAGLGYYARARNLLKCARLINGEYNGALPKTEIALKSLPGIGDYTAAAIASIAFGKRALVIDANIERVIARVYEIDTPLPKGKADIRKALDTIVPHKRAGDLAQAMMDLGAFHCSTKSPKCNICPIMKHCGAVKHKKQLFYPVKPAKKVKPMRIGMAWWIIHEDHILLVRRPNKGMLGGMRSLPDDGWNATCDGDNMLPFPIKSDKIVKKSLLNEHVQHSFTHFSLKLKLTIIELKQKLDINDMNMDDAIWWPMADIAGAGLPTTFGKAAKIILNKK